MAVSFMLLRLFAVFGSPKEALPFTRVSVRRTRCTWRFRSKSSHLRARSSPVVVSLGPGSLCA
jgi:hypothetical protein